MSPWELIFRGHPVSKVGLPICFPPRAIHPLAKVTTSERFRDQCRLAVRRLLESARRRSARDLTGAATRAKAMPTLLSSLSIASLPGLRTNDALPPAPPRGFGRFVDYQRWPASFPIHFSRSNDISSRVTNSVGRRVHDSTTCDSQGRCRGPIGQRGYITGSQGGGRRPGKPASSAPLITSGINGKTVNAGGQSRSDRRDSLPLRLEMQGAAQHGRILD